MGGGSIKLWYTFTYVFFTETHLYHCCCTVAPHHFITEPSALLTQLTFIFGLFHNNIIRQLQVVSELLSVAISFCPLAHSQSMVCQ